MFLLNKTTIASCGLDRFLNVYDYKNNCIETHLYLKTKLNCLLPIEYPEVVEESEEEDDEYNDGEEGGEISDDLEDEEDDEEEN